ncbi:MAG: TrkA family potassium uptake protein [Desulfatirhabdiaceae bacterium]
MNTGRAFIGYVLALVALVMGGALGYVLIEDWDLIDALYMTVITLATIGYGEVHSLSRIGRIYTMFLILVGVGFLGYLGAAIIQFMVEGRIRAILGRKRLDRKIEKLRNHYIVCGYGRIGRVLCTHIRHKPLDLVVVEKDEKLVQVMEEDGIPYIWGDSADETILIKAGIQRAHGLVAALGTDIDNVFLVLTARQLKSDLFIMARATQKESQKKLMAAGATSVVSPYEIGATSMAQRIIRPTVTSFLDFALTYQRKDIQMEEIPVIEKSRLVNVMLKDSRIRQDFNLIIIAIKKEDGEMNFNPSFETRIEAGSTVIAVGQTENLLKLEKELNPC